MVGFSIAFRLNNYTIHLSHFIGAGVRQAVVAVVNNAIGQENVLHLSLSAGNNQWVSTGYTEGMGVVFSLQDAEQTKDAYGEFFKGNGNFKI
jgi:hypothetical protein